MANFKEVIQFINGAVRSNNALTVDLDLYVPAGNEQIIVWEVQNEDRIALNYLRVGNSLEYSPPVVAPVVVPDVDGFLTAIWDDPNLATVRMNLLLWKPLLIEYLRSGTEGITRIQEAWVSIKTQLDAVNPAIAPIVEGYAEASNIPLVAA